MKCCVNTVIFRYRSTVVVMPALECSVMFNPGKLVRVLLRGSPRLRSWFASPGTPSYKSKEGVLCRKSLQLLVGA